MADQSAATESKLGEKASEVVSEVEEDQIGERTEDTRSEKGDEEEVSDPRRQPPKKSEVEAEMNAPRVETDPPRRSMDVEGEGEEGEGGGVENDVENEEGYGEEEQQDMYDKEDEGETGEDELKKRIERNVWDTDAWMEFLRSLMQQRPFEDVVDGYEKFISRFPTSQDGWIAYIEHARRERKSVETIDTLFERALSECPTVQLFTLYISFVKENHPSEVVHAYERAIETVGLDMMSNGLWHGFILQCISEDVRVEYDKTRKGGKVKSLLERAMSIPLRDLENIIRDPEVQEFVRTAGSWMLSSPKLSIIVSGARVVEQGIAAISVFRDRKPIREEISYNLLARPPHGEDPEKRQLHLWRELIESEKSNPLGVDDVDLIARVSHLFKQQLLMFRHHPHVWCDFAEYLAQQNKPQKARQVYEEGVLACTGSRHAALMMYFAWADMEEMLRESEKAIAVYERALTHSKELDDSHSTTLTYIRFQSFLRRVGHEREARVLAFTAMKSGGCTYHIFLATAEMEYRMTKDPTNVVQLLNAGKKEHGSDVRFLQGYAEILWNLNDESNLRALFEQSLPTLDARKSIGLWNMYFAFEKMYGTPATLRSTEERRRAVTGSLDDSAQCRTFRYSFRDLFPSRDVEEKIAVDLTMRKEFRTSEKEARQGIVPQKPDERLSHEEKTLERRRRLEDVQNRLKKLPRPNVDLLGEQGDKMGGKSWLARPAVIINLSSLPSGVRQLLDALPPSSLFKGPLEPVDKVLTRIQQFVLPADFVMPSMRKRGRSTDGERKSSSEGYAGRHGQEVADAYMQRLQSKRAKR
eukprot:TRINITY_DN466_c0_g1_i1.p1 TRINITY_DN466_c0_g1~~TRINITY_DN466_c0_g1_i1.p1  ORF type:complete len:811 (-),score=256.00 TRINITY_DN466_c0_g1_i1:73-2505(-)